MNYNELYSLCEGRHSCRDFDPAPLTEEQVKQLLQLARTAPFASGRKNWDIHVVSDREIIDRMATVVDQESDALREKVAPEYAGMFGEYTRFFSLFKKAPALFIPVFRFSPTLKILLGDHCTPEIATMERDNMVKSISCVTMLILLGAQSLELGACYMTGGLVAEKKLKEILQMPSGQEIGAIIPVGRPAQRAQSERNGL
ncbi:MAG: nitroreductase family protein [Bacteroidales bacterium]